METLATHQWIVVPVIASVTLLIWAISRHLFGKQMPEKLVPVSAVNKSVAVLTPHLCDKEKISQSVVDQFPLKDRVSLQTRVANATTAHDLLRIFADYKILERLRLPTQRISTDELGQANEQAFRDLVRERILINDTPVDPAENSSKDFKKDFHSKIQETIAPHVEDTAKRAVISTHLCCHLSRTRAGGDSYFAIQDLFASPQFTFTAAAAYTHPPTSLLVTPDGWAVITTTSNFDVYFRSDLHHGSDEHPEPLVTVSAVAEEAIPLSHTAKKAWSTFADSLDTTISGSNHSDSGHGTAALPVSRTLRLTCTLPMSSMHWAYTPEGRDKGFTTGYSPAPLSSDSTPHSGNKRGTPINDIASPSSSGRFSAIETGSYGSPSEAVGDGRASTPHLQVAADRNSPTIFKSGGNYAPRGASGSPNYDDLDIMSDSMKALRGVNGFRSKNSFEKKQ
jgi:hypothetical protein